MPPLAFEIILLTHPPLGYSFSAFFSSFSPLSLKLKCACSIRGDIFTYQLPVPNSVPAFAVRGPLINALYWFKKDFSVQLCHLSVPKLPTTCRIKFNFLSLELKGSYHLVLHFCYTSPFLFFNTNLSPGMPPYSNCPHSGLWDFAQVASCSDPYPYLIPPPLDAYTNHTHLLWSGSNSIYSQRHAWPLKRIAILPSWYFLSTSSL